MKRNRMKQLAALLLVALMMGIVPGTLGMAVWAGAAEPTAYGSPLVTVQAERGCLNGNTYVSGEKVGNLGCGGTVTFYNIDVPKDGEYILRVHYYSGSDDRYFNMTVDGVESVLACPNTGSFDTVGSISVKIRLKKGSTICLGANQTSWAPDLDKIEIYAASESDIFPSREYGESEGFIWRDMLALDTANGLYSILSEGKMVLKNAHAEVKLDGEIIAAHDFRTHTYKEEGDTVYFIHSGHSDFAGTLTQTFRLKDSYLLTEVTMSGESGTISTNYISVLTAYEDCVQMENSVFLQMPFENGWDEPKFISVKDLGYVTKSYEVGVFFHENTSSAFVLGSVAHDTWKTGVTVYAQDDRLKGVNLFAGVSDSVTGDALPHGSVSGRSVSSPLMLLGVFDDWRDGLTAYGKANTDVAPAKESISSVPFGYNSWGSLQTNVNYSDMVDTSNFIKENFQEIWEEDGVVYVNLDSYWGALASNDPNCGMNLDEALRSFVQICHDNGQKAGIYDTPFASWQGSVDAMKNEKMEGSDYTYYDAALKKEDGSLYGSLSGWVLDPTHPGTIARIEHQMNYFMDLGFEYVKLDFLTNGSVEGDHYLDEITTGMQAYNYGMAKIHEICNGRMFVNLSISPVFPYQYADGRRISCDSFGSYGHTQHVLSYLTANFWHKEIYAYPDPDHIVTNGVAKGEARCRVTSGVITGTSFLVGDDLSEITEGSGQHSRLLELLTDRDVIRVAKLGKVFRPLEISAGQRHADTFYLVHDGCIYLAVFNFSDKKLTKEIDLSSIWPEGSGEAVAVDLWRNQEVTVSDFKLECSVPKIDVALMVLSIDSDESETDSSGDVMDPYPDVDTDSAGGTETEIQTGTGDHGETHAQESPKGGCSSSVGAGWMLISVGLISLAVMKKKRKKSGSDRELR